MPPLPHNPAQFAADLVHALDEVQRWKHSRPHYNEKTWFRCLKAAADRDQARQLVDHYAKSDARDHQHLHVRYYEHLASDAIGRMNGKPLRLSATDPEMRTLSAIRVAE